MSEAAENEFLLHETLPDERLSFGKFSNDGRFFIFLTDEDRYLKSYIYTGASSNTMQKLYLYAADENELHFLGDFTGDYRGLWFSEDVRYAAIARGDGNKNLIVFNLETREKHADILIGSTDAEQAWHRNADTADGYLICNSYFDSLNFDVGADGRIFLRWFLSMHYGPDGGPGATYGSANHIYAEAERLADGQTRVLRETFGAGDERHNYSYPTEDGKYYVYSNQPRVVYGSSDNAVQNDKYGVVESAAGMARVYDLTAPPPADAPDLDVDERFSRFYVGEKSALIVALVYGDFTIWRLDLPSDTRRPKRYMDEIIRRTEKQRRRQLKKEMAPRSATWREILLSAALIFIFGMIFNYCH